MSIGLLTILLILGPAPNAMATELTVEQAEERARQAQERGDFVESLEFFQRASEQRPTDVDLLLEVAWLEQALDRHGAAYVTLTRAVRFDAGRWEVQRSLGLTCLHLGRFDEADRAYRAALTLREDPQVHYEAAEVHVRAGGGLDRALQHLQRALELQPGRADAHSLAGDIWENRGDPERAIQGWSQAIALDPAYCPARNNLGRLRMEQGQHRAALEQYDACLAADPAFTPALLNRGATYLMLGDCEKARPDLEAVVKLEPTTELGKMAAKLLRENCG